MLTSVPLLSRQRVSVFFVQFSLMRLARVLVSAARLCALSCGLRRFASEAQSVALSVGSVGNVPTAGMLDGSEVSAGQDQAAG